MISLQVRVQIEDGGSPPRMRSELLTVNVLRNLFSPVFSNDEYEASILETHGIGRSVTKVSAKDEDRKVKKN